MLDQMFTAENFCRIYDAEKRITMVGETLNILGYNPESATAPMRRMAEC